ncbi:Fe-only nitrogenase accessory protein AnfO [Oxobacter pfennigii]|nr:Fe-only nitrogenase accessory protein AnfO [Oxobacter pfennigii]
MKKNIEIAVLLDKNGDTSSVDDKGIIKIYKRVRGKWTVLKEILFYLDSSSGLRSIRDQISAIIDELGDCRVFVGEKVNGLVYNILEMKGFNSWEFEGKPADFLDYIQGKETEAESSESPCEAKFPPIPYPVEANQNGYYFMDLKPLQNIKSNVSSKQALLPFLKNTRFYELEIICSHVPQWFEIEFERLNLKGNIISRENNEYKIIVRPKTCNAAE